MRTMRISFFICLILLSFHSISAQNGPDPVRRLRLLFVGDIMGHDSQIESAAIEKNVLYDYSPCFEYVAPILKDVDLAIGNLELTLPGEPPYKGYPQFRSPDDLALALRHAGFDLLATANNHSNDAGKMGVVNTLNTLDEYGFYHTGTFRNEAERKAYYPLIVYKNNFKLAFLNYTYSTNGIPTKEPTIVNLIDPRQIEADMAVARSLDPDAIIVIMHWGKEYQLEESKEQAQLAQKLFKWGADLVIGAHPHVVQPVKTYPYTDRYGASKTGLVAYSLGNFISGQRRTNTDGGIMLEVELKKHVDKPGVELNDYAFIPVWRHIEQESSGRRHYRVVPVAAFEQLKPVPSGFTTADREKMQKYADFTRQHLKRFEAEERMVKLSAATAVKSETARK